MKKIITFILGFIFILNLVPIMADSNADLRVSLEKEIAEAEAQKKSGMIWVGAGMVTALASLLFIPSYEYTYDSVNGWEDKESGSMEMYLGLLIAGSIMNVYGGYTWWDASQTLATLKGKRYDLGIKPEININPSGIAMDEIIKFGVKLSVAY